MRISYLRSGISLWCLIFFFFSCQKDISTAPEIHILSPMVDQSFENSNVLEVRADINDIDGIRNYEILLKSDSDFKYYEDKVVINKQEHSIYYKFEMNDNWEKKLTLVLTAEDKDGNKSQKKRQLQRKE